MGARPTLHDGLTAPVVGVARATNYSVSRYQVMLTQLNPPLPLETSKGTGLAHFVIDYGPEAHLLWVVFMDQDGSCWSVPNPEVRMQANWSMERRLSHTTASSPANRL